jgi:hypothetical protein
MAASTVLILAMGIAAAASACYQGRGSSTVVTATARE